MSQVGQAYTAWLTPKEQEALAGGIDLLIDGLFEDLMQMQDWEPEELANSTFGEHLPPRYLPKYTPLFLKQFFVCVVTVGWKLAQPEPLRLSSVAEELAAFAIIETAKVHIEFLQEQATSESDTSPEEAFEDFMEALFEDTDFLFLFEDEHDGIDQSAIGQMMGMASLSFEDWFKPFSTEPERIAHPYIS